MISVKKNKKVLIIGILVILGILIRIVFFDFISVDYKMFLSKWLEHLKNNNGIFGIKTIKSDYNLPYLIFLSLINYIPIKNLYLIKILSCLFDFLLAKLGYDFIKYFTKNEKYSIICFGLILFFPTVIINSAVWGQCDSIYTFFALSSLFYLIKKEYHKSFIFLGIAFSLKLQTCFIFPIYVILYLKEKRFSFNYFFYVPLVNFILCLPCHLIGIDLLYTYKIYFYQTKEYKTTTAINILRILPQNQLWLSYLFLFVSALIFLLLAIKYYRVKEKLNDNKIVTITLLYIVSCYYFLPFMHERYMYMADVLCIIWFIIHRKKIIVPISIFYCSLLGYIFYIDMVLKTNLYWYLYVFIFPGIIIMFISIYKLIRFQKDK